MTMMITLTQFLVVILLRYGTRNVTAEPSVKNPNLALFKQATQSSTDGANDASKAVDGNGNSAFNMGSCSKTLSNETWNWWTVDLGHVHTIKSVRIDNANDIDGYHVWLTNFQVEVSLSEPSTLIGFPQFVQSGASVCLHQTTPVPPRVPTTYACETPVTGRFVRVVKRNPDIQSPLLICEFEVYDYVALNVYTNPQYLPAPDNLALNKNASVSDGPRPASLAVDGNMENHRSDCIITNILSTQHWLMVDLGHSYVVESIRLLNAWNLNQHMLSNFTVEVSVDDPTTFAGFPSVTGSPVCHKQNDIVPYDAPVPYTCDTPLVGRYVRIVKSGEPLIVCEFEIFGYVNNVTRSSGINDILNWRFVFQASQGVEVSRQSSQTTRIGAFKCARERVAMPRDIETLRFFHLNLENDTCRFFQTFSDTLTVSSTKWVVYKLV